MTSQAGKFTRTEGGLRAFLSDCLQLGKPRITTMVIVSTMLGFVLASPGPLNMRVFWFMVLGTALVSWGIHALNQYMERDLDGVMPRTMNRPLPTGRMRPEPVLYWGIVVALAGLAVLFLLCNLVSGLVGTAVVVLYVLVYTPMKRVSPLNTLVGAVPGALPPVLGWAAATGGLDIRALNLFLIMFIWQLPHFLPIAWLYRNDYRRANLPMLTARDPEGHRLKRMQVIYTIALVVVSLGPTWLGMTGTIYLVGALALGVGFLAASLWLATHLSDINARMVLKVSVIYLPLLLGLLVYDTRAF